MENEVKPKIEGDIGIPSVGTPPQKSKKAIFVALILIILIIIGGIIYWQYNINTSRESADKELPEKIETEKGKVSFKNLVSECNDIEEPFRQTCIQSTCDAVGTIQEKIDRCLAIDAVTFKEEEIYQMRDQCLNSISPETMIEVCDAMHGSTGSYNGPKDLCYLGIAKKTGDESACDKMDGDLPRRLLCYKEVARINENSEVCKKIDYDYFLNWCSKDINKNYSLCTLHLDWFDIYHSEEYRNWCLAVATGDLSKCDSIDGSVHSANDGNIKGNCYSEIAEDEDDSSVCEKIDWYNNSRMNCYLDLSKLKRDTSLCDKLEEPIKNSCYLIVEMQEALEKGDYSICERGDLEDKDNCYYQFAMEKKDISLCDRLSPEDESYYCYFFLSKLIAEELNQNLSQEEKSLYNEYCEVAENETKKEKEIIAEAEEIIKRARNVDEAVAKCRELSEWQKYAFCISNLAVIEKDPSVCKENIDIEGTTGYSLELCLAPLVMELNDTSICKLIPTKRGQNECYVALAVKNNDPKICDLVEVIQITEFSRDETYTKSKCIDINIGKDIIPQKYEKYR